jgi:phosphate transporter
MFGSGMLSEVDFNSLNWHTLFLVGGGNVLGKAVQVSGLLEYLADGIVDTLPLNSPWLALVFILFFVMTISVFVSHTVSAIILMPVITRIGVSLQIPEVVVIGSAWACSCAMALPFSSFPNVNSLQIIDDFHRPYLGVQDFIRAGLPMSVISVLLIGTVGFGMINLVFG